jgi:hypothetical protein
VIRAEHKAIYALAAQGVENFLMQQVGDNTCDLCYSRFGFGILVLLTCRISSKGRSLERGWVAAATTQIDGTSRGGETATRPRAGQKRKIRELRLGLVRGVVLGCPGTNVFGSPGRMSLAEPAQNMHPAAEIYLKIE